MLNETIMQWRLACDNLSNANDAKTYFMIIIHNSFHRNPRNKNIVYYRTFMLWESLFILPPYSTLTLLSMISLLQYHS